MMTKVKQIKVPKILTDKLPNEYEPSGLFNIMSIPDDVWVGNMNLSNGIIHPIDMTDDPFNKNMAICSFNSSILDDNAVNVYVRNGNKLEPIMVDIDILFDKINVSLDKNKLIEVEEDIEF